jgi:hypothetical protein
MAELTPSDEKLAEVLGLAQAAQKLTADVAKLEGADRFAPQLEQMGQEAAETERRTDALVETLEGKKTAIQDMARETKTEAQEMAETYLAGEDEALDGFEFLTMAEAGEVGHWSVLSQMAEKAGNAEVLALAEWALPIQKRHFNDVKEISLQLAAQEDPNETA